MSVRFFSMLVMATTMSGTSLSYAQEEVPATGTVQDVELVSMMNSTTGRMTGIEIVIEIDGGKKIAVLQDLDQKGGFVRPGDRVRVMQKVGFSRVTFLDRSSALLSAKAF